MRTKFRSASYAMAQSVGAQRYKPEGRVFDYRWGTWDFKLMIFLATLCPLGQLSL